MALLEIIPVWIREIPDLKTQEICNEAMRIEPYSLAFVPDNLKTQEMCDKSVEIDPYILWHVPDHFKTQEMCIKAVGAGPSLLPYVPDRFKTQEMCNEAVRMDSWSLEYIPDWFVKQQHIEAWGDDVDYFDDDEDNFFQWYNGYQKRKAQKAQIIKELMPIAWHPDRVMGWSASEDEKRRWK